MINWNILCVVLYCNMSKFTPNKENSRRALVFCCHLKKTAVNHFEKLMVNMLHRKIRANYGFGVSKVATSIQDKKKDEERGKQPRKFEDVDGDLSTQKPLAEQLGVNQQAVFNRLREMGKIQKTC